MRDEWLKQSEWKWSEGSNDGVATQTYFIVSINSPYYCYRIGSNEIKLNEMK